MERERESTYIERGAVWERKKESVDSRVLGF